MSNTEPLAADAGRRVLDLDPLLQQRVDGTTKGLPPGCPPMALGDVGQQGWRVPDGDLPLPVAVLRQSAVEHNLRLLQRWAEERGALLAPHGKTTMAPQIFDRQLALGAWAITVATPHQLSVALAHGVQRVLLANQLVDFGAAVWLFGALEADPEREVLVYVDSVEGAELLAATAAEAGLTRPVDVLLEVGYTGGRTGTRTAAQAAAVVRAVEHAAPRLRLRGVSGFEGLVPVQRFSADTGDDAAAQVRALLEDMAATYAGLCERGLLPDGHIVTAGGSAAFDAVVDVLGPEMRAGGRLVLRSGCYVTHDHGMYAGSSPLQAPPGASDDDGSLRPALEVWSVVQSAPEPGLALLTFGRRDTGHDYGFPVPLRTVSADGTAGADLRDAHISALNDQHAYLRLPPETKLEVGERVVCGISHPCTTFDKWRVLPVVDDAGTVVDAVATFF